MKTRLKRMALPGALLLSTFAFAQGAERTQPQRGARPGTQAGQQQVGVEEINFDEKGLLERLHELHQREIAWGKLARDNASMASTREYAESMVRDHESADQRVTQLADQRKVKLGKPDYTSREKRMKSMTDATESVLKEAQGPSFDSIYLSNQVMGHDKAIQFFTAAQSRFGGAEMTPVLSQVIPRLVSHREQAYRALGDIPSSRAMGGSGMGTGGTGGKVKGPEDMGGSGSDMGTGTGTNGKRRDGTK
jgi:putative membrane protein